MTGSALSRLMEQGRTVTLDELAQMWADFHRTQDPALRARLAEQYALMVKYVAQMIATNAPPWVDRDDHLSYGYMGLLDAINKFDPTKGIRFETYATKRIRGAILDGLRKEDPLTRRDRRDVKTLYCVYDAFWEEHGREPTRGELAEETGMEYADVSMTMQVAKTLTVSLQEPPTGVDEEGAGLLDSRPDTSGDDPVLAGEFSQLCDRVSEIVADLDDREHRFIFLHYAQGLSLKDVGAEMGISDARAGQIRLDLIESIRRCPA